MVGHQLVELGDALQSLGQAPGRQALAGFVHQVDIVMGLGPVVAHEDRHSSPPRFVFDTSPRTPRRRPNGSVLDWHATPSALQAALTEPAGARSNPGDQLSSQATTVLTGQLARDQASHGPVGSH